ncbi:MAG: prepilin-type N-terminal cleavage/methylation domain-containing protein [Patescibacteria group bacterium]
MLRGRKQSGFTIVELLIVVVVIAILAAITITAYNGIQNRARASAAQSAAAQVAKKIAYWQVENPNQSPGDLTTAGLALDSSLVSEYTPSSNGVWCATITANNTSYFVSNTGTNPTAGGCAGHAANGVSAITNYATNPHAVSGGGAWTNQTPSGSTISYQSTAAQDGGSAYRVITTAAGQLRIGIPSSVGAVATNDTVSVGVDLYSSVATQAQIEVGLSTAVYPKSGLVTVNAGWNRLEGTVTIPAAANVTLIQILGAAGGVASGTTWIASKAIITKNSSVYPYSDGNTSNWVWIGTINNSPSKGTPLS